MRRCRYTEQPGGYVDDAASRLRALWRALTAAAVDPVDAVLADDQLLDQVAIAGSGPPPDSRRQVPLPSTGCRGARTGQRRR